MLLRLGQQAGVVVVFADAHPFLSRKSRSGHAQEPMFWQEQADKELVMPEQRNEYEAREFKRCLSPSLVDDECHALFVCTSTA
jgi:hypothetical protein